MQHSRPFFCLYADAKPTVETLGPTVKSEETTTPYPIDEEATECGENCSFEDGEDGGQSHISSRMAWVPTSRGGSLAAAGAGTWRSPGSEVRECGSQGLGAVAVYKQSGSIQILEQPVQPHGHEASSEKSSSLALTFHLQHPHLWSFFY